MKYVTYYGSINGGLSDVEFHDNKDDAVKFYRKYAHHYFYGLKLLAKTTPPTACGFAHRVFGVMSIRMFRKRFPEWKGGRLIRRVPWAKESQTNNN